MRFRLTLSIIFLFSLVSCGTTSLKLKSLGGQQQTIFLNGFSVISPVGYGWKCILENSKGNSVNLVRGEGNSGETEAYMAHKLQLPQFTDSNAFVSYIKDEFSSEHDKRFSVRKFDVDAVTTKHGVCVSVQYKVKDLSARKIISSTGGSIPMTLETISLICRNPSTTSEAVHLVYSHRYFLAKRNLVLIPANDMAQNIFESLEFNSSFKAKSEEVCP